MEVSEEHHSSSPIPQTVLDQKQGLGSQSNPNPNPNHPPNPNLDPLPIDGDKLNQIVAQELQNLDLKASINEDVHNLAFQLLTTDEEREFKQRVDEEIRQFVLKQAINEALHRRSQNQSIDEEIASKLALSEVLHDALRKTDEAQNGAVVEANEVKEDALTVENELPNDTVLEENEVKEKCSGDFLKEEKENKEWNDSDEAKDSDGVDNNGNNWSETENDGWNFSNEVKDEYGIDNYEDNRSDSKKEGCYSENAIGYETNGGEGESGEVAGSKDGKYRKHQYPLRPDAEDCSFYMRAGNCKFGSNCKFNHPLRRKNQAAKESVKQTEENSERPGQTECKYYLTSGGCKFGKACRYNHSRGRAAVAPILEFNFLGLPIRLGEKECTYYMRHGSCKYGLNCRFNHPDPTAVGGGDLLSGYGNGTVQTSKDTISGWSSPRTLNETASFVPMMYSPTPGVPSPNTEWNGYQAPTYPPPERSLPTPPAFSMNNPATDTNFYTSHRQPMLVEEFPERPGQPECTFFLKTGDCKYRSVCKFHHPKSRMPKASPCTLSDKGLPLRPDQIICTHYSRYGICKFGPACKFDHPVNYSDHASSAGSGPGQPPLFGNSSAADGEWKRESLMQQSV